MQGKCQGYQKQTFCVNECGKHNPRQDQCCNLSEKYFFSEKFAYTDIEICENKKQLWILN